MRVLLVGGGGREHALASGIVASPLLGALFCAPGNAGIAALAECVAIAAEDVAGLVAFARANAIDLVVVGPEAPLTLGLADACAEAGIACFGPSAAAAGLEGSKTFTKQVADAAGVPTATWARFEDALAARAYVRAQGAPIVVKADGLAAGKGVVVAATVAEAEDAITDIMEDRVHGAAGAAVVIEECLVGEEVSFFALCDGTHALAFGAAQDHKRAFDGDQGPNTGGMGTYSPAPVFTAELVDQVREQLAERAFAGIAKDGAPYRGVLFVELMATGTGPKLVEFNVRFGDPECQVLMLRLESDLVPYLLACATGRLAEMPAPVWRDAAAVCVVLAAEGYPDAPRAGGAIRGADADFGPDVAVFHAGTRLDAEGVLRAAGGRVLNVCARAPTLREALDRAYATVDAIDFPDGFCRRDIGWRALG